MSEALAVSTPADFSVDTVRRDFPALRQRVNDHPLVYLDSAATALKPQAVIDAVTTAYARDSANVHRGVHQLSQRATEAYEGAREKLRAFLNAPRVEEIVFVRGTTEAINLVAQSFARPRLRPGDEILITGLEHHSNIVPWQLLTEQTGARLVVAPIADDGSVPLAGVEERLTERTRLVSVAHVSNALGSILPVSAIAERAHAVGARVLVDGAQSVPHLPVDLASLGVDFYAFSGHKLYGPTGIGVLWARADLLEEMPPYQGGGDMIRSVSFEGTTFAEIPHKFEAGTPNIAGAIGLGAAVDYVTAIGLPAIEAHERDLLSYGTEALRSVPGLRIIGNASAKTGVLSFVVDGIHAHDLGTIVDAAGVAIRTGHHCAQPAMRRFGVPATARASLGIYNTRDDLTRLVAAIGDAKEMFS